MPRKRVLLPVRTLEEVLVAFPSLRQSTLAKMDDCALSTLFELEGLSFSNAAQARGTIGHRAAAEIMRTMRATGEVQMPVPEALEILYEVCAQRDVPDEEVVVVPMRERRMLRVAIIRLVGREFANMHRIIDVERRLSAEIQYPHPDGGTVTRLLTGQPDVLLSDPPDGATILDWKFSWGVPPAGAPAGTPNGEHHDDPDHVSYQGYFQQRFYALLVMRTYGAVQRVSLREFYPLKSVARWGTVLRSDLEHVERELSSIAEVLDRALAGGSKSRIWSPQPGRHCAFCARPQRCPIDADERVEAGGITSWAEAERAAAQFVVATEVRSDLRQALAGWADAHGPIPVRSAKGRYELRWRENSTGRGRSFGVYVPDESDRGPRDPQLDQVFRQVADRARESATKGQG